MNLTNWTLKHPQFGDLPCQVPFSMYSVLLAHQKIEDPFYRDREYELRPLSDQDYTFETQWEVAPELLALPHQILRFEGIDTLASIYVNDQFIGSADNMHRTWEYDVRAALQAGSNLLRVVLHAPVPYMQDKQAKHFVWGQSGTIEGFAHIRKASCMFGWDWAPQLPDMGIFRPVSLLYFENRLTDVRLHQEHKNGKVQLFIEADTEEILAAGDALVACIDGPDGSHQTVTLATGAGVITIENPQLWWPRGYGAQSLYTVTISLLRQGQAMDAWERRIGLRTLTVSTAADRYGNEFCFVVNGLKVFAMGADYVPEDSLISRITPERTRHLIETCAEANFNAIRVWGGGGYPSDAFFDLCDEYGLIVWQDFMFACVNVWLSEPFTANIRQEFIDNLRRIRHHACLGLLCGNNEMEMAVTRWDGCKDSELAKLDYLNLYEHILPDLCEAYAPDTFYWPSSPSSCGGFDNPEDENRGDAHYWGAWHGSIPFESYRKYYFRFCSEFGFEAFPNLKTIRSYAEPEDMNPFSRIMESHQKCLSGNTKILSYASDKYLYPFDFPTLVYTSQLLQADAIRYGVEHFRRFRGRCMGAIYWQLNDCWPVASWASVDYFGRWKALMYSSKRFFAPQLLSAHEDDLTVILNLSNESPTAFEGRVRWRVIDRDFNVYMQDEMFASVSALSAKDLITLDLTPYLENRRAERLLAYELLTADGDVLSSSSLLLCKPKHFALRTPNIQVAITGSNGNFTLEVSGDTYAKSVEIDFTNADVRLSDNYFDIISAAPITLTGRCEDTSLTAEDLAAQLTIRTVASIGQIKKEAND